MFSAVTFARLDAWFKAAEQPFDKDRWGDFPGLKDDKMRKKTRGISLFLD